MTDLELAAWIQDPDGVTTALLHDMGISDSERVAAMAEYNATHGTR